MVDVDPDLAVDIEHGQESAYHIEIRYDGTTITAYGSAAEPWGKSGRLMLGNVIAARLEGYDRDEASRLLATAFREHESTIQAAFD